VQPSEAEASLKKKKPSEAEASALASWIVNNRKLLGMWADRPKLYPKSDFKLPSPCGIFDHLGMYMPLAGCYGSDNLPYLAMSSFACFVHSALILCVCGEDLLEIGWGWERFLLWDESCDLSSYKNYLKEYHCRTRMNPLPRHGRLGKLLMPLVVTKETGRNKLLLTAR
jgi:hypothetical protein